MNDKTKLYNVPLAIAVLLIAVFGGVLFYNVKFIDEKFTQPALLTLYDSPGCGHCKDFLPIWDGDATDIDPKTSECRSLKCELNKQNVQVNLRKVNIDDPANSKLANEKKITSVPTLILTKNGQDIEFKNERTPTNIALFVQSNTTS